VRVAFFVLVLACGTAMAERFPSETVVRLPLVLRLQGIFAVDREHARAYGADAVSMRIGDDRRWFSAIETRTVGGDPAVSGRTVLNALAPYDPNLLVLGPDDLRARLAAIPPGIPVRVEGLVDRAARTYLLREVIVGNAAP
jgi:hypothetical protein